MTVLTIRPGSADSNLIGALRNSDATYANARAGTGTFTSFSSAATIPGGQRLNAGTYDLNQQFYGFATGSSVPSAVVSSVVFEWTTFTSNVTGGDAQSILAYDAGTIANADWRDGTALGSLTSWGSIPSTGYQSNSTTYQISLNATAIASVQTTLRAGGTVAFMICATDQVNNVAPVGNDRYDFYSEQDATAANRPALIITYSENLGSRIISGAKTSRMRLWR